MKPYPAYKDSGVEWIGKIPEHWDVVQIKRLSPVKRGASPRPIEDPKYFDDNGEFAWVRIADVSSSDRYLESTTQTLSELGASLSVKRYPGNLFLSIAGTVGKPIITRIKCCIHDGFVWFPNLKINPEYLYFIFSAGEAYKGLGKWGTQLNLNTETVGSIPLPFPPEEVELEGIINFLDHKTSQIDTLISKKQKQIELLKEERTAIINQAVTKGLNPDVPMKDSGIEWLGEVPEHWSIKKLKFLSSIDTGEKDTVDREDDGKYPFFVRSQTVEYINSYSFDGEAVLTAGDGVGVGKVFHYYNGKFDYHQRVYKISNFKEIYGKYLFYYMQENFHKDVMKISAKSTVDSLRLPMFLDFLVAYGDFEEQKQIVEFIEDKILFIDTLNNSIQNQIILLQEYRTALISNAVTGKIDVRDTPTVILE